MNMELIKIDLINIIVELRPTWNSSLNKKTIYAACMEEKKEFNSTVDLF